MPILLAISALLTAVAVMLEKSRRAARASAQVADTHARAAEEETERLSRRVRHLQREVELLSAIREVSLIANDDVSFERILSDVLKIVEDLVEAREVAIFLVDETTGELRPRVVRRAGQSRFEAFEDEERALEDEALRERRTLRRLEQGGLAVATLLFADAEIAGVLSARADAAGRGDDEIAFLETALEALGKHVALAIKKPTLYDRAVIDSLTRLFTKRHFTSQLARACAQSRRTRASFALVLCDIDHFKRVNDTHGHLTGDLVLAEVAATIRATIREYDTAYRYGGEEMAIIAPDADLAAARKLAERIRVAIETKSFRTAKGEAMRVTSSFGISAFGPERDEPEKLIAFADEGLYAAKGAGRNRVRAVGDPVEKVVAPVPEVKQEAALQVIAKRPRARKKAPAT